MVMEEPSYSDTLDSSLSENTDFLQSKVFPINLIGKVRNKTEWCILLVYIQNRSRRERKSRVRGRERKEKKTANSKKNLRVSERIIEEQISGR